MVLSRGIFAVDLNFLGTARAIATLVLHGSSGVALVDPGPTTCVAALEAGLAQAGLGLSDVTDILVTHIHLDHSGSVGMIARRHPSVRVWVHELGLPHLADPTKLVGSASRLHGDQMERLWGEVAPVPSNVLRPLIGGERIDVVGRRLEVAYTPGHASHHVSYFDLESRLAMVGDVAGVRIATSFVLPPTPPPDIDLAAWPESVARVESWAPTALFLTHFGAVESPGPHFRALFENLDMMSAWVAESLAEDGTDAERASRFARRLTRHLFATLTEREISVYTVAAPFELLWGGLARYWRKASKTTTPSTPGSGGPEIAA